MTEARDQSNIVMNHWMPAASGSRRGKTHILLSSLQKETALQIPGFSSIKLISDFRPPEL